MYISVRKIGFIAAVFILINLVIALLYNGTLGRLHLNPSQAAFWDVAIKALGGIAALAGAYIGITRYLDEKFKTNQAALIEAQKPLQSKRQEIYYQTVLCTGSLSNKDKDDSGREELEDEFWRLYWGPMPLVADEEVAKALDLFSETLEHPSKPIPIRNASMELARSCRRSLGFIEQ